MSFAHYTSQVLLCIFLISSCNSTFNTEISASETVYKYIVENCREEKGCEISLKKATDFSWDKLYVFRENVETEEINKLLNISYHHSSPYYSRKWFFVKDSKVVKFQEFIMSDIDDPVEDNDILLQRENPKHDYQVFDRNEVFKVSKNKLEENKHYYYLTCKSCLNE